MDVCGQRTHYLYVYTNSSPMDPNNIYYDYHLKIENSLDSTHTHYTLGHVDDDDSY